MPELRWRMMLVNGRAEKILEFATWKIIDGRNQKVFEPVPIMELDTSYFDQGNMPCESLGNPTTTTTSELVTE